jgi:hypothetical protein
LSGEAQSQALSAEEMAGAHVHVPAAWTAANLGFMVSPTKDGTYVVLNDELGVPVQIAGIITNAANAYVVPDGMYPAGYFKLWSKSAVAATRTDVDQEADRSLTIVLKG